MTTPPPLPSQYPENSQATTALVLAILGFVICWILPPFAWVMGNNELKGIAAGRRDPSGKGIANAAKIMGIIGTVFLAIGVGLFLLVFVVGSSGQEVSDIFREIESELDT